MAVGDRCKHCGYLESLHRKKQEIPLGKKDNFDVTLAECPGFELGNTIPAKVFRGGRMLPGPWNKDVTRRKEKGAGT